MRSLLARLRTLEYWQTYLCGIGYGTVVISVVSWYGGPLFIASPALGLRDQWRELQSVFLSILAIAFITGLGILVSSQHIKLASVKVLLLTIGTAVVAAYVSSFLLEFTNQSILLTQAFFFLGFPMAAMGGAGAGISLMVTIRAFLGQNLGTYQFRTVAYAGAALGLLVFVFLGGRRDYFAIGFIAAMAGYEWIACFAGTLYVTYLKSKLEEDSGVGSYL